jgi:hypothetical protein
MKQYVLILSTLLLLSPVYAQTFRYKADVGSVPKDGFYRIMLSAEVLGQLNEQVSDIRLYDNKQQEVPWLLKKEQPVQQKALFQEYEIVRKVSTPKAGTSLVVRNVAKSPINNISLVIKNANVRKKARLSGSTDAKSWYVIEEAYNLEALYSTAATTEVKLLDFPLSDYEYYLLEINDSLSPPLNILKVGYYNVQSENGKYSDVPGITFTQKDSSAVRQSYVHISLPYQARIDKLIIDVQRPARYRRSATLSTVQFYKNRRGKETLVYEPIHSIELHSAGESTVFLPGVPVKDFYLIIDNEDNPPLVIGALKAYQLNTYLVAELKQDKSYHLSFGNPDTPKPSYDLSYFEDKIPANLATLNVKAVVSTTPTKVASGSPTFFTSKWFIWAAIGLVILVLSYLSYQILIEVAKK